MDTQINEFKRHEVLQNLFSEICAKLEELEYDIAFEGHSADEAEELTQARWARLEALECAGVGLLGTDNTEYKIYSRALESVAAELEAIEEEISGELVAH